MATIRSSCSSDEFHDAADDFASENSDNEENAPVWASFSQPKSSHVIAPAFPPPPPRNNVPLLPAPPAAGNGRPRALRIQQQSSSNEIQERKILSNGGTPTREIFQRFGSQPTTATEDTPQRRRKKLDELRNQLRSFETGDDENEARKIIPGQKISPPSDASSMSSLSWSKTTLAVAEETQKDLAATATSMVPEQISNEASRVKCETNRLVSSSARTSTSRLESSSSIGGIAKLTADSELQQVPVSSSSSSSANSSKANTLDTCAPTGSASSVCLSHRRPSSARSSKSNSLPKEISSISTCEHYLYSNEMDDLVTLARKNSEAAEVIEALTSELVQKTEIEREQLRKSSSSIAEVPNEDAESDACFSPGPTDAAACSSGTVAKTRSLEERTKRNTRSVKEPDIVSSNRVKASGSGADSVEEPKAPAKPPRGRRSIDSRLGVLSRSPLAVDHAALVPSQSVAVTIDGVGASAVSDKAALSSFMVKNLDTGEKMPLAAFDEKSQQPCMNPLTRHIMQLTAEDTTAGSDCVDTDSESMISSEDVGSMRNVSTRENYLNFAKQTTLRYKKVIGKKVGRAMHKTVSKMKQMKDEVSQHWHKEESSQSDDEDNSESNKVIRVRASHHHKGPYHFDQIKMAQDLSGEHTGSVWSIKYSHCGRVMATAGQDKDIRIWVLKESFNYFSDMRQKYSAEDCDKFNSVFMSPATDNFPCGTLSHSSSMSSVHRSDDEIGKSYSTIELTGVGQNIDSISLCSGVTSASSSAQHDDTLAPFVPKPFCVFKGHSADVLDLCWSKNYFLLSSSMDRTVRLWHISRKECLCCFQHAEFVSAIAFLPKDDRYFLSVSLDGKLRVWHIPEKKVALWNEVEGGKLITALTFARNGKFVVVGTTDGRCVFYTTERLKYHTQIDVKSSHGKNSRGHKVTGLDSFQDKLLVTSSDSRIRLYDTRDLSLTCKYKGYYNYGSQIRASFSHDGKYIVCGSEDKNVYLWKTVVDTDMLSLPVRKDRNRRWESIRAHNAVVTAAVFAPRPDLIYKQIEERKNKLSTDQAGVNDVRLPGPRVTAATAGEVLVTADFGGAIYVFFNKPKVRLGSSVFLPSY